MIKGRNKYLIAITLGLLTAGVFTFLSQSQETKDLPPPRAYEDIEPSPRPVPGIKTPPQNPLPSEVNLAVPFTSQAPHQNWDLPYKEFCEEASLLMADHYLTHQSIPTPEYADQEMLKIKTFEEQRFGYYEDTTAEQTAMILREYFGIEQVQVVYDPQISDIKQALAQGQLVIAPAAGRELPNPYFRNPGPLYHMLVIKGYTQAGKFITNDPGTRRGTDFLYAPEALMNAIHDWNDGNVEAGRKVIIIVG